MHKALDPMNLQIHHVIADITGKSGTDIMEAIIAGRRDPATLAELGDKRLRATKATLRAALTGDYRQEHLFCLRQAYAGYQFVMQQIAEVDTQLAAMLAALAAAPAPAMESGPAQTKPRPSASSPPTTRAD